MSAIPGFDSLLDEHLRRYRRKRFCTFSIDQVTLTYGDLCQRVNTCADALREARIGPGCRVVLALTASADMVVLLLAVMRVGALAVPADATHPSTIAGTISAIDPHLVVSNTAGGSEGMGRASGTVARWELRPSAEPSPETAMARLGVFTSGSCGTPKCVLLSEVNLLAGAGYVRDGHGLDEHDTAICCLPLSHLNGIVTTLLTPLLCGGSVVFQQGRFVPSALVDLIRYQRATWFSAVPTHYRRLLDLEPLTAPLSTCRFGRSASAPLTPLVQQGVEGRLGIPIVQTMGLTECAGQVFANPMSLAERRLGSVGRPFGNEAQVCDDAGRVVPDGQIGELCVRGPNLMVGYFRAPKETAAVFRDGWLRTGDLGYRDTDGFFSVTGRIKLVAIFGGTNISLVAVEQAAMTLPPIIDAAAVAHADSLYGEVVDLYYTCREIDGIDEATLRRDIQTSVRPLLPDDRALRRVQRIGEMPKTETGKVLRHRLSALGAGL